MSGATTSTPRSPASETLLLHKISSGSPNSNLASSTILGPLRSSIRRLRVTKSPEGKAKGMTESSSRTKNGIYGPTQLCSRHFLNRRNRNVPGLAHPSTPTIYECQVLGSNPLGSKIPQGRVTTNPAEEKEEEETQLLGGDLRQRESTVTFCQESDHSSSPPLSSGPAKPPRTFVLAENSSEAE